MSVLLQREQAMRTSRAIRFERALLRAEVAQRQRSLAPLVEQRHPALDGVRCYQLCAWLYCVGERKATRMLRGLPGHLPLHKLRDSQRDCLLERITAQERRIEARS